MCGIVGFLGGYCEGDDEELLRRMANSLVHRGPDNGGCWHDREQRIGLGHRRLAIVDLSPAGHQPMVSFSGRYVLAFNGEIYNHLSLRKDLESSCQLLSGLAQANGRAFSWQGHSDTETLLAGFETWGFEPTLKACVGMFAIALWDREEKILSLARDRLGEKPLYYSCQKGIVLFGSELKALKEHPSFEKEIDRDALALQLGHNYIPAPYSIYKNIRKLLPGTWLQVRAGEKVTEPTAYWSLLDVINQGKTVPFSGSDGEAVATLDALLRESVASQMMADVPLGAFLSGGVDSSAIVALMQAQSTRPVKTFTIGFHEKGYNEAEHALAVANHLGTDHTEIYVSPRQALEVIPRLPALYDEPFSDSSQIPTFLVSEMTRQHVTVSLSGDGGDELFGGYNRYVLGQRLWGKLSRVPVGVRRLLAHMISSIPARTWNYLLGPIQGILPLGLAQANIGDKLIKGAEVMTARTSTELYRQLVSHWADPSTLVIGAIEPPTRLTTKENQPNTDHFVHQMMALDLLTYLPDDILVKVDRAAMGVSLETRVPMLDHRVVELAWSLPLSLKIREGQGKWILRQVLDKYVPRELIERPKMGFGVPIDAWLRGPLREWAESLLDESRLKREGFFRPAPIRQKWEEHLTGLRNWQYYLWDVLMFQAWLEAQGS